MSEKVQIFITHYETTRPDRHGMVKPYSLLLKNTIKSVKRHTVHPDYEIVVVYNYDTREDSRRLEKSVQPDVKLLHNRRGKSYQSAVNLAHLTAETKYFVLLHNDVKVPHGWLRNLLIEIKNAEKQFKTPCMISPSYLDYLIEDEDRKHPFFWHLHEAGRAKFPKEMEEYCKRYNIPFQNGYVYCKSPYEGPVELEGTPVTDSGATIMMHIANSRWHEVGGLFDESMCGFGFADADWGIRALLNGAKHLVSHTVFFMHISGVTTTEHRFEVNNVEIFRRKWGEEILQKYLDGSIWPELHGRQRRCLQ
ncbi:MAG: glycosyltransferase [Deltaproteobacteria bacterium]|nr:glycosyltransferase [Deltaproteobacteria bacterium]